MKAMKELKDIYFHKNFSTLFCFCLSWFWFSGKFLNLLFFNFFNFFHFNPLPSSPVSHSFSTIMIPYLKLSNVDNNTNDDYGDDENEHEHRTAGKLVEVL